MSVTVSSNVAPAVVQVATDGSGKRVANYAVQMWVDPGTGPALQTVYFQAVDVFQLDENGAPVGKDDQVEYEWKRQLLDEMRAIRLGMELLLELGQPSYDIARFSLIEEARTIRLDRASPTDNVLEMEQ
jgi:hypothetical protein